MGRGKLLFSISQDSESAKTLQGLDTLERQLSNNNHSTDQRPNLSFPKGLVRDPVQGICFNFTCRRSKLCVFCLSSEGVCDCLGLLRKVVTILLLVCNLLGFSQMKI